MDIFAQLGEYFKPIQSKGINASQRKQFIGTAERLMNSELNLSSGDISEMLFAYSQNNNLKLSAEMIEKFTEKINHRALTIDGCLEAFEEVFEGELA